MRSKTSFFNPALFWKTVWRFWPVWGLYAFVWLLSLPAAILSRSGHGSPEYLEYSLRELVLSSPGVEGTIMALIFCGLAAMAVYSHLYNTRSAGAYGSMPLTRGAVFVSVSLAGLLPLLAINVLIFLASLLAELSLGLVFAADLWVWLGLVTLLDVAFFGIAAFCAMLTGNIVVFPVLYAVVNFGFSLAEEAMRFILSRTVFGWDRSSAYVLTFLSPAVQNTSYYSVNITRLGSEVVYKGIDGVVYIALLAAVGAMLFVCALLLYRRRRMEAAGDVVAVSALRPVFKYVLGAGMALGLGSVMYSMLVSYGSGSLKYALLMLAFVLFGGFVGYFAALMLLRKTFRVWRGKRDWLGFAVLSLLLAALLISAELDLTGYERRTPSPDAVKTVSISGSGGTAELSRPENIAAFIAAHGDIAADKGYQEASADANAYTTAIYASYVLKDGSTLSRRWNLALEDRNGVLEELERVMNCDEARLNRAGADRQVVISGISWANLEYGIPDPNTGYASYEYMDLTAEEAYELYTECVLPEISAGKLGLVYLVQDEEYLNSVYDCTFTFDYGSKDGTNSFYGNFRPTAESVLTNAWLTEHGVELYTLAECGSSPDGKYDYGYEIPAAEAVKYID